VRGLQVFGRERKRAAVRAIELGELAGKQRTGGAREFLPGDERVRIGRRGDGGREELQDGQRPRVSVGVLRAEGGSDVQRAPDDRAREDQEGEEDRQYLSTV
jgi:hypothetical protein